MVRFDFVLDRNLKLFLLEVNMSPNLSSGHFPPNRLLYEQVVFGLLNLVGVARSVTDDLPQRCNLFSFIFFYNTFQYRFVVKGYTIDI